MFESDVNIEPALVKEKIDKGEKPVLLDIRNPWEVQVARIEGRRTSRWPSSSTGWRRFRRTRRSSWSATRGGVP